MEKPGKLETKKSENKETRNEVKAKILLNEAQEELRPIFDMCANISHDQFPKSSSTIGEPREVEIRGRTRVVSDTIQSTKFPEMFNAFSETEFLQTRIEPLLAKAGYTYNDFVSFAKNVFSENPKELDSDLKDKMIDVLFKFCDLYRMDVMPSFDLDKGHTETIQQSDILINLFINLINRAQFL